MDTKVVVESCQHPEAEATGLMDTTLKTYLTWYCPECGKEGTLAISRDSYNEVAAAVEKEGN